MGKDTGWWIDAPEGGIVACFAAFDPILGCEEGGDLELFLLANGKAEAKERARGLGIPYPSLYRDKDKIIVEDEAVQAVAASDSGAVWGRRGWDPEGQYRDIKDWPGTYEQRRC